MGHIIDTAYFNITTPKFAWVIWYEQRKASHKPVLISKIEAESSLYKTNVLTVKYLNRNNHSRRENWEWIHEWQRQRGHLWDALRLTEETEIDIFTTVKGPRQCPLVSFSQ
jgi:hypothetical protein